ncbi:MULTISPECIES: nucleoside deaminase [Holospora]|uniref:tRNA-specific adenosine deaminase n=2 Tax=Holospora TaxID=44747 RepID=A0A061JHU7_9PROT|nr:MULTISPECIES: nucleoside deaminase [Holospora]ETZ04504.1 tRNA-specific adenosine deaminase [Holospora undulata HU1]GAJ46268.1 tRNA-specific adenosine deaminase [Holospora elegans E1]
MFSELHPFMDYALVLAKKAELQGEVPVGAVLVYNDKIILENHNKMRQNNNPLAHAELLLLQEAYSFLKTYYLSQCSLFVTLEPCGMCATAVALSRLKAVYFGAYDPKHGGIEHGARVFDKEQNFFKPKTVVAGVRAYHCENILKNFFSYRRG